MRQRKVTVLLILANLCLFTLYVSGWTSREARVPRAKSNGKTVSKHFAPKDEPVEVAELKIKGRAVKLGEAVEDEADWLKHVTFKVKNRSGKAVTFLQVDLDFPETQATGSIMMHQLFIGRAPELGSTSLREPLHLRPNESVTISLEPEYADIERFIELRQPPIGAISKVVVRLGEVGFEDGTRYSAGNFFRRNPDQSSPQKWVPAADAGAGHQNY